MIMTKGYDAVWITIELMILNRTSNNNNTGSPNKILFRVLHTLSCEKLMFYFNNDALNHQKKNKKKL